MVSEWRPAVPVYVGGGSTTKRTDRQRQPCFSSSMDSLAEQ